MQKTLLLPVLLLALDARAAPSAGEHYFLRNCAMCHSTSSAAGAGPGLAGTFGRTLGSAPGYGYSDAMARAGAAGRTWDASTLDAYLADPGAAVPGTSMPLNVARKADRDTVIAYLATLGAPAPAPAGAALASTPFTEDAPGTLHLIKPSELVAPFATASAGNAPKVVPRPEGALPRVPAGFKVNLFATDADKGRLMIRAPNGDVFMSVAHKGKIKVFRSSDGERADIESDFIIGLDRPFGIAFYPSGDNPRYLYVATVNQVIRIPYQRGALKAGAPPQVVVPTLTAAKGSHSSRTLVFSADDRQMFVSIGSATNVADTMDPAPPVPLAQWERKYGLGAAWGDELDRAVVLSFDPEGQQRHTYATGLRNCVGMGVYPPTGALFCAVNERDALGDRLPPDYLTSVTRGGFYGWPWYYIGANEDPRLPGKRPDLRNKVTVPDVLLPAHSAPLGMAPYIAPRGARHIFPKEYNGDIFLALHGSWNSATRSGSKVVRVMMRNGRPTGAFQDFVTGMVINHKEVWGRPSSVLVARDGSMLVDDDANGHIWRIVPDKSL